MLRAVGYDGLTNENSTEKENDMLGCAWVRLFVQQQQQRVFGAESHDARVGLARVPEICRRKGQRVMHGVRGRVVGECSGN